MNKEYLIKKWLDKDLTPQEFEDFKMLKEYKALIKLSNYSKGFKAPEYNTDEALQNTMRAIAAKKTSSKNWLQPLLKIAAILAICIGGYYYTTTLDSSFNTSLAEKTSIELPDNSTVNLNALSTITFNKNNWDQNRSLSLNGEAFFNVKKGSNFSVLTDTVTINVIGTQFNIKQRQDYFEVVCYEGEVQINYNTGKTNLKAGDSFLIIKGEKVERLATNKAQPDWLNNVSSFISVPLSEVLFEFERQFNVKIEVNNIKTSQLFTGKFTHNDITIALKSITEPLQLQYKKVNQTIILVRE